MDTQRDPPSDGSERQVLRSAWIRPETFEILRRVGTLMYHRGFNSFIELAVVEKCARAGSITGVRAFPMPTDERPLGVGLDELLVFVTALSTRIETASKGARFSIDDETRFHLAEVLNAFPRGPHRPMVVVPPPDQFSGPHSSPLRVRFLPTHDLAVLAAAERLPDMNFSRFINAALFEKAESLGLAEPGSTDIRISAYPSPDLLGLNRLLEEPARAVIAAAKILRRRMEDGASAPMAVVEEIRAASGRLSRQMLKLRVAEDLDDE